MTTQYLIFHQEQLALIKTEEGFGLPSRCKVSEDIIAFEHLIAEQDGISYYVVDLKKVSQDSLLEFTPLKQSCVLLKENYFPVVSKAAQVVRWNSKYQFCSLCGSPTRHQEGLWEKHCLRCHHIFYPHIAPSIIVLIKKGDEILMARGPHFPEGVHALIAGFVEPGESLEEAVHREVAEEVGITIKNLRYHSSQSWPFPNSLMLAFTADYAAGEIRIDSNEIESAGWYRKDNLPGLPSYSFSIAMKLIQEFVEK